MSDFEIAFPQNFPIKIIGKMADNFANEVAGIVTRHAPDFDAATIEMRASQNSNYLSLTCTIVAQSRPQLDALYRELCAHPQIKFVL